MAFEWAITSYNKLRSTWTDATIISASSEASGYPKENAIDGNIESSWKASVASASIIIDSGNTSLDIDYLFLRFRKDNVPTSVNIETSDSVGSGYAEIANNYDGGVATTTDGALTGTSRYVYVDDVSNIEVGNTVRISDGVKTTKKYMVVKVGADYIEVDRMPEAYADEANVVVYPDAHMLASVAGSESKRYIRITVTCATYAQLLEVMGFSVNYVFDNTDLPLNPMPIEYGKELGNINRTFSGYGVGRMTSAPAIIRFSINIQRLYRTGMDVIDTLTNGDRFGILMDDGQWYEGVLTTVSGSRRRSSDAELITYGSTLLFECI